MIWSRNRVFALGIGPMSYGSCNGSGWSLLLYQTAFDHFLIDKFLTRMQVQILVLMISEKNMPFLVEKYNGIKRVKINS